MDSATQALFDTGHAVGDVARRLYDPDNSGALIDGSGGMSTALQATRSATERGLHHPIFEATVERDGLLIRADVIEPVNGDAGNRLIEVKSSTSVKAEHATDCAIQAWVLETSALRPDSVWVAHVDNTFVYQGAGRYDGLLKEVDMTEAIRPLLPEVEKWKDAAQVTLAGPEPAEPIGSRCRAPYDCPFVSHCWPPVDYPLTSLPAVGRRVDSLVATGYRDVRDIAERDLWSPAAKRVWRVARAGKAEFIPAGLKDLPLDDWPRYYLDFETVGPAVPIWPGTRPYQSVPFQWSLHAQTGPGRLVHREFLHLEATHPARLVAEALLAAVGTRGPVFTYSSYERRCLVELAACCPDLADRLGALAARLVDLLPPLKASWYHPEMHGSWSIKAVLPTIAPDMDYRQLEGVQEGAGAQRAWFRAIDRATPAPERDALRAQLLRYCGYDTLAMVRVVEFLERSLKAGTGS